MTRRLEHWRCDVCRERGSVVPPRSGTAFLLRLLADHRARSPVCELVPESVPISIVGGCPGWVLRRPQSTGPAADKPA